MLSINAIIKMFLLSKSSHESGEKYTPIKHRLQAKTGFKQICERTTEDFFTAWSIIMDSYFGQEWRLEFKTF